MMPFVFLIVIIKDPINFFSGQQFTTQVIFYQNKVIFEGNDFYICNIERNAYSFFLFYFDRFLFFLNTLIKCRFGCSQVCF